MIREPLFLPISSNTLPHYFGKGILLPSKYYSNKAPDIQNRTGSSILLCSNRWVKNSDCCLEVALTEKEHASLNQISQHFFVFNSALPISRVKKVFFKNTEQAKTTAWNINNGAAFLPEYLVEIDNLESTDQITEEELTNLKDNGNAADFLKKAKYYDHVLGGVSLLRIAGEPYMDYSQNYFAIVGYFNNKINEDFNKAISEKRLNKSPQNLTAIFAKNDNEWSKWQSYLYQNITFEDVENIANSERVKIQKRLGLPQLDNINPNSIVYDLLVLATYGESKNKGLDNFVSDIITGYFPKIKTEELALLVGLNNGYSNLRNKYKLPNASKIVKFELNSRLDYYIIESIFQFAFNGIKDNSLFSYINEFVPERTESKPSQRPYRILDKWVVPKKKPQVFSPEYLEEFLQNNSPKEIYQTITKSVFQWCPPFVYKNAEDGEKFFENALRSPINNWWRNLINQLRADYQESLDDEKQELLDGAKSEKELLQQKINSLIEEVNNLKMQIASLQDSRSPISKKPHPPMNSTLESQQNLVNEDSSDVNYNTLSVPKLKKVAKEKGIKPLPTSKDELIKAIKSVKTFL